MTKLSNATLRRLSTLKRTSSVWEGARRSLPRKSYSSKDDSNVLHLHQEEEIPECILWVDGSMGMVRYIDVTPASAGQDAVTRALIHAIERPQGPAVPALPQKILVCDRELQFYLRGILQELDIAVEYAETLPLIDELFANMIQHISSSPPLVPPALAHQLLESSAQLWKNAPWQNLLDHQVVAIEMNCWDVEQLFAVVMGNLGLERGILFYRTYDSLFQFRERLSNSQDNEDSMEETFLVQDCLFNLFETEEDIDETDIRFLELHGWKLRDEYPVFGSLHPLEGARNHLYEEEAAALTIAISAFSQFYKQHGRKFKDSQFPKCQGVYVIESSQGVHQITVQTMPDLANELKELDDLDEPESDEEVDALVAPRYRRLELLKDLVPDGTIFRLLETPWTELGFLRSLPHCQLDEEQFPKKGKSISNLLIQTSRAKAIQMTRDIQEKGGIMGLAMLPGLDADGDPLQSLVFLMNNGELQHLIDIYMDNPREVEDFQVWQKRCESLGDRCIVTVAMGIRKAKGIPEQEHFLAYYEVRLIPFPELRSLLFNQLP